MLHYDIESFNKILRFIIQCEFLRVRVQKRTVFKLNTVNLILKMNYYAHTPI